MENVSYTSFQNGRNFSILSFTCKLALVASFKGWFPYDRRRSRIADRKKFCDRLRSYENTLLRSSAIVIADDRSAEDRTMFYLLRSSAIVCDRLRSITILRPYGNQSSAIFDQNISHNILNSDPWFNAS